MDVLRNGHADRVRQPPASLASRTTNSWVPSTRHTVGEELTTATISSRHQHPRLPAQCGVRHHSPGPPPEPNLPHRGCGWLTGGRLTASETATSGAASCHLSSRSHHQCVAPSQHGPRLGDREARRRECSDESHACRGSRAVASSAKTRTGPALSRSPLPPTPSPGRQPASSIGLPALRPIPEIVPADVGELTLPGNDRVHRVRHRVAA